MIDKPGIDNSTFSIPFNKDWLNRDIITPRNYKVTTTSEIRWMSRKEIINEFLDYLTEEQLELLKQNP